MFYSIDASWIFFYLEHCDLRESLEPGPDSLKDRQHQKGMKKQKLSKEMLQNTAQPLASKETLCRCPEREGRKREVVPAKQENNRLDHYLPAPELERRLRR